MVRRNKWDIYSEKEILDMVRGELERLDLLDHPSRTKLEKGYERGKIPSPNWLANKYGTWEKVVEALGLEYDKRKINQKSGSAEKSQTKWKTKGAEELIEVTVDEMHRVGEVRATLYGEVRDPDTTPAVSTLYYAGISWKDVRNRYREKYGR